MRIKFGSIVVDGRNKLGGHVYSKNRGGNYVRTNIVPTNPQTAHQIEVRGRFAIASAGWKALSEEMRNQWADFAKNNPYQDLFGDSRTLAGNSAFVRSQVNAQTAELASTAQPIEVDESIIITGVRVAIKDDGDLSIDLGTSSSANMGGAKLVVHATPGFPASQNYSTNKFRVIGAFGATSIVNDEIDASGEYSNRFPDPVIGEKVDVKLVLIKTNGTSTLIGGASGIVVGA